MAAYPQVYPKQNGIIYIPGFSSFTSPIPGSIESELIDPVYTLGDSLTWTHGRHTIKVGFQVDLHRHQFLQHQQQRDTRRNSGRRQHRSGRNQYDSRAGRREPGLGDEACLPISPARFRRSLEGFGVANGKNPQWIVYPSRAAFEQRDANGFIKDDFKVTSNLTVNYRHALGLDRNSVGKVGTRTGADYRFRRRFRNFRYELCQCHVDARAPTRAPLTQMQTVGPNSSNPGQQLYQNYYKSL